MLPQRLPHRKFNTKDSKELPYHLLTIKKDISG